MEEVHDKVDLDLVEDRLTSHQPSPPPSFEVDEVLSDEELPDFEPEGTFTSLPTTCWSPPTPTHLAKYQAARWEASP